MRLSPCLLVLGLAVLAASSSARADDVNPVAQNLLWGTQLVPTGLQENPGQFSGFSAVSSSAATPAAANPGESTSPKSGGFRLEVSHLGGSFAGAPPEFFIGDTIGLPLVTFPNAQSIPVKLRREPVRKTDPTFRYRLAGDPTIRDFNPASQILTERFFWSPHATYTVTNSTAGYEGLAGPGTTGGAARDGFTYADQAGGATLYYRTEALIDKDGNNVAVYGLVSRAITVSSSSRLPVRRIFWTENGFQGPVVPVPKGDIQNVRVAYTDAIPELVPADRVYKVPGSVSTGQEVPLATFTLYYDSTQGALRAYNLQGRVMIELLGESRPGSTGLRRQIGIEVVDIVQEAAPGLVEVPLGERLYPLPPEQSAKKVYPLSDDNARRAASLGFVAEQLSNYDPALVLSLKSLKSSFTGQFIVDGQTAYFAERATTSASDVQIFWLESGLANLQWPKFLNRYHQYWPESLSDYAVNVRPSDDKLVGGTLPIFGALSNFQLIYQDDPLAVQATTKDATKFQVPLTTADPVNRSLLLFQGGEDGAFWYVRVESVLDSYVSNSRYAAYYRDSEPTTPTVRTGVLAPIGARLQPPAGASSVAGYVDLTLGDAIDLSAYIDPFAAGIPAAERGAIIPVNAAPRGAAKKDQLAVWWFKKINPPSTLVGKIEPIYWPSFYTRYQLVWPANASQIVLASNKGSGDLDPDAASPSIYIQNDPALAGYNPNEEHALMIAGRAYALRTELNHPLTTSDAYVLVRYSSATDQRPAMKTFRVLRENETNTFNYPAKAGTVLQPPLPLAIMPPPIRSDTKRSANTEVTLPNIDPPTANLVGAGLAYYSNFTFEDRNGLKWIYRAQHTPNNSPPPPLQMKFYYATRKEFSFPDSISGENKAPLVGTITPFLHDGFNGDAVTGTAITINFTPYWPDLVPEGMGLQRTEVPELQSAETLVKSKFGLPSLKGASSAKILYQQSIGKPSTPVKSAKLHDATRRKIALLSRNGLPALPASISTTTSRGRTYFQNLPAHLQERFYFDPLLGTASPPLGGLVLEGVFKEETVGEDYLLPNILSTPDLNAITGLATASDPRREAWITAVTNLATILETFQEDPNVPGTYIANSTKDVVFLQNQLVEVTSDEQAVDSYALTGVGGGTGYVTLLLGNGNAFTDPTEPVQVQILKVVPQLYTGQVKPLTPANPLSEQLTLQHTGDFAGSVPDYEFEWFYVPALSGQPPATSDRPDQPSINSWFRVNTPQGTSVNEPRVTLGGSQPLLSLTDNYYIMHYRRKTGDTSWSDWTAPALAEGWVKRVLAGINPFNQRLSDFYNNTVNTDVSLLTQAGKRWEGDVALTLDSVQDAGLIEIYETVLKRGINFTIEGTPAFDYGPANDALLLAAGYLNDLYMALGNEAYADASNPLISLDVDPNRLLSQQGLPSSIGTTIQTTASARFTFEGQVASLLDEELTLLRGRDDFLVPGVLTAPVYNRFFWNYTRGINAGEVIYALNYNITEKAGTGADGKIDAKDAARQYPQGHGDAYGYYLTALKNYYRLLSDPNFTWTPRVEAVNILGVPVTVDYQDERKLALAAVSLGRTASRIIDLERRQLPIGTDTGWAALRESKPNPSTKKTRTWGVEQWASRGGQGNFIHWAVVNALLPENDAAHEGLQKIDRQNVPELDELTSLGAEIQGHLDDANRRANALNLSDDSILFDLSPAQMAAGNTHFDQILARAKAALANAATAHARTVDQNALLRSVENQASDYNFTVTEQESAFNSRLREIYGQPYTGDIGPGKFYPQGYDGPDYLRFMFIDRPYIYEAKELFGSTTPTNKFILPIKQSDYSKMIANFNGTMAGVGSLIDAFTTIQSSTDPTINFSYTFDLNNGPYQIAFTAMGRRGSTGQAQDALTRVMNAREQVFNKLSAMSGANDSYLATLTRFQEDLQTKVSVRVANSFFADGKLIAEKILGLLALIKEFKTQEATDIQALAESLADGFPGVVGLANDIFAPARAAVLASGYLTSKAITKSDYALQIGSYITRTTLDITELAKNEAVAELNWQSDNRLNIDKLKAAYSAVNAGVSDLDASNRELVNALNNYQNILIRGLALQAERETFRKRAASAVQGSRTRDVAFRAFRTESLEQYKILFDQAARYAFLAAKAYDYETGSLGTDSGRDFLSKIVATRALGLVGSNGEPQFGGSGNGDPGLSSFLAQLQADWSVAKGRLGINNPDQYGTLFSLRRELFNLPYKEDGSPEDHVGWQDKLRASMVNDLRTDPDIAAHALPTANPSGLAQPGIVINFSSDIDAGLNFFGNVLNSGDSTYSTASYSTKISSVGVVFQGYLGMNPYAGGGTGIPPAPTHGAADALSATPYVYLIPAGIDRQRTPPLNGAPVTVRHWLVLDHAMPLPYDIGSSGFGQNTRWTSSTALSEPFFLPRMHQAFRAVADPTLFYSRVPDEFTNRRLVGRSVWNTKWKLVIPAQTLLADPLDGVDRFVRSVKDIKLFLRTYSNAGN